MRMLRSVIFAIAWLVFCSFAMAITFHGSVGVVKKGNYAGTGTIVAHHLNGLHSLVLTATHVIDAPGPLTFTRPGGQSVQGVYLRGKRSTDLATFVIPKINVEPMPIWPGSAPIGASAWAEGFASIGAGRLRGKLERIYHDGRLDTSIGSRSGDSGSAIYVVDKAKQMYVVGVITGYYGNDNEMTTGAGPDLIRQCIEGISISEGGEPSVALVEKTGHVLFGGQGPIRRLLQGRNHPQPWSLGIGVGIGGSGSRGAGQQSCPPGGCPPSQGWQQPPGAGQFPGLVEEPPAFVQPPYQPPAQQQPQFQQPTPAGPDIDELLRRQQELLDQQRQRQKPIYSLPGELRADFDASGLKEELLEDMANDSRFRGRDGVDGRNGKDGRDGQDGLSADIDEEALAQRIRAMVPDAEVTDEHLSAIANSLYAQMQQDPSFRGPPGESANIDVDVLTKKIMASLPSIQVDLVDPDGGRTSVKQDLSKGDATFEFRFKNRMNIATPQQRTR